MNINAVQFADSSSSGLGAFHVNLKSFIFQMVTFLIVLLVLKRWALPKLIETIENRREVLEKSLDQAKETEKALADAEAKAGDLLNRARGQADEALGDARNQAKELITAAEAAAGQKAEAIIKEGQLQLERDRLQLKSELKSELAALVTEASEKIVRQKLTGAADHELVSKSIEEVRT